MLDGQISLWYNSSMKNKGELKMESVVQWLEANAEFDSEQNAYYDEGGYCDSTRFQIIGDKINVYWSDEYGQDSDRDLTIDEFKQEYMI